MNATLSPSFLAEYSADPTDIQHYGNTPLIVHSSGSVVWVPPMTTKTECPMDLTYWPFDTQRCTIYLGSWTTDGFQIDFVPVKPNATTVRGVVHLKANYNSNSYSELQCSDNTNGIPNISR